MNNLEKFFEEVYKVSRLQEETGEKYFNDFIRPNLNDDKKYNEFIRADGTYTNDTSWIDRARDTRAGERFTDQQYREDPNTHQNLGKIDYFEGAGIDDFKNDYERVSQQYKNGKEQKIKNRVDAMHDFFERYCDYVEKRKEEGMTFYPDD